MRKDKKQLKQILEIPSSTVIKRKSNFRNFEFLTEVLACIAWTTKA
ncbi:MAG: hypothetical protein PVG75_09750 [Thioalkalispiraceae bacterium]|jgi:hypothetical protein